MYGTYEIAHSSSKDINNSLETENPAMTMNIEEVNSSTASPLPVRDTLRITFDKGNVALWFKVHLVCARGSRFETYVQKVSVLNATKKISGKRARFLPERRQYRRSWRSSHLEGIQGRSDTQS